MIRLGAAWVVPVDRPAMRDGWVAVHQGRIVALGDAGTPDAGRFGELVPLGEVAILPGLVNAHVHVELSWLRGRVPPAARFTDWVSRLLAARGAPHGPVESHVLDAAARAVAEMQATGTAAVGDISNSLAVVDRVAEGGLCGWVFHELIGFRETGGALVERTRAVRAAAERHPDLRVSLAPHAPYSVSAELFRAVHDAVRERPGAPSSVHLAESPEELELLAHGTGEWARLLRDLGAWRDDWRPPASGPVEYLDRLGVIDAGTLAVHGVQLTDEELVRLRERGATLVTCPRSNTWVGVGDPPVARFYHSGVRVAVGTDSLASVADLNLFAELQALRRLAPGVAARTLLASATLAGAEALGLGDDLGSLTPGKRADIVAVRLPAGVPDAEEWLVSGVHAGAISWASRSRDTIA